MELKKSTEMKCGYCWQSVGHAEGCKGASITDLVLPAPASGAPDLPPLPDAHAALRRLAEAATPGPWFEADWSDDFGSNRTTIESRVPEVLHAGQTSIWPDGVQSIGIADCANGVQPIIDAKFVAAANPARIIALLDEVADLRAALAQAAPASPNTISEDDLASLLPGSYYMDPPDGGSVSVMEQLRRMADDAAKYRAPASPASAPVAPTETEAELLRSHLEDAKELIQKMMKQETAPYGYVWFDKNMEHRFTRGYPHEFYNPADIKPVFERAPLAVKVEAQQAGVPARQAPRFIGYYNIIHNTFLRPHELAATQRTNEMLMSGKIVRIYHPAAPLPPVVARKVLDEIPEGPAYGIIDPDYARYYSIIRCTAWQYGYAIGMHGSFTRDLDLIAVPWSDEARDPDHLVRVIVSRTDLAIQHGSPGTKPHGRIAYTLTLPGFGDPRWIDLSIMPRLTAIDAACLPSTNGSGVQDGIG